MNVMNPIRARIPRFLGLGTPPPVVPRRIVPRLIQAFPSEPDLRPVFMSGATAHIPAPVPPPLSLSSFQSTEILEETGYGVSRGSVSTPIKAGMPRVQITTPSETLEGYSYGIARGSVSTPIKAGMPRIQIIAPSFVDDPTSVLHLQAPPVSTTPVIVRHIPRRSMIQPVLVDDWDWMVYVVFRHTVFTHFPDCHPVHGQADEACGKRDRADEDCGSHGRGDESCGPRVKTDSCCP